MAITLYGIPNCDTVKKARVWLAQAGREVRFVDFKRGGVPEDRLDAWIAALGWERLLNQRGTTWRQLDEAQRASVVDAASARHLMLAQASVVNVSISEITGAIRMEVHDNGKSFQVLQTLSAKTNQRLGLLGMRERVEIVGGTLSIESTPGQGTTVRAEIPFRPGGGA